MDISHLARGAIKKEQLKELLEELAPLSWGLLGRIEGCMELPAIAFGSSTEKLLKSAP